MTSYQRARRLYAWRGSANALLLFTAWMLASAYSGYLTN